MENSPAAEYLIETFGNKYLQDYLTFLEQPHASYLRINSEKTTEEKLRADLSRYGISITAHETVPECFRVEGEHSVIGKTIEHVLGHFYIQSLSSMIPAFVVQPEEGEKILDLCAAPGSKATQLSSMMHNRGMLVLNEIQSDRIQALVFNIDRMNSANAGIIHQRGEWLSHSFANYFDKVLVDAPCSGLGILQKKSEVIGWWNKSIAERLAEIQHRLLVSALRMVKPGGHIIYSTCTLAVEENEKVINKFTERFPAELIPFELPLLFSEPVMQYGADNFNAQIRLAKRILPWIVDSEGFFTAKLRKTGEMPDQEQTISSRKNTPLLTSREIRNYRESMERDFGIESSAFESYRYIKNKENIYFVAADFDDEDTGKYQRIGLRLGKPVHDSFLKVSAHALQVFEQFITKNKIELENKEEVRTYLRGGTIKKNYGLKGQAAVYYRGNLFGPGVVSSEGMKSQFPRAFRTQEIIIPD